MWPFKNACLDCDPLTERAQDQLGACTLVGKPRRPAHCILKGQLYFEQRHERPVNIFRENEVSEVTSHANKLREEYFPSSQPFTKEQIIQIIDNHEPTVITINCVMASLQSQEAIKVLHHLYTPSGEKRLGNLLLNYTIYNGLTGKFYDFEKPRNSKCEICGDQRTQLYRIKVKKDSSLSKLINWFSKEKNIPLDSEFPPTVFRIDTSSVEEIDLNQTVFEAGLRNYETILVTGFDDGSQLYLILKLEG